MSSKKTKQKGAASAGKKPIAAAWLALILGVLTFLVYAPSISNGYSMDDELVTRDHRLTAQGMSAIPEIFHSYYYFDNAYNYYGFRPVVLASFAIEHDLFGEDPQTGHAINILLYALTCALIFSTLVRLTRPRSWWLPALATLIFALHPLHTEVVMSLKNRDELLGMLFVMLSLWAALRYVDRRQIGWALLSIGSFALAMLSIPTIAPLALFIPLALVLFRQVSKVDLALLGIPIALLTGFFLPSASMRLPVMVLFSLLPFGLLYITGKWKTQEGAVTGNSPGKWVYLLTTFGLLMFAIWGIANFNRMERVRSNNLPEVSERIDLRIKPGRRVSKSENPLALGSTVSERLGTSFEVMGIYLKLHLLPYPLRYYYGFNQVEIVPMTNFWAILSLIVHLGLGLLVLLYWRRYPLLAFAVAWYLAGVLAASNLPLLMVGIVGERLIYPASLGFAVGVAWLLVRLLKPDTTTPGLSFKGMSPTLMGVLLVIVVGYSGIVITRAPAWKDRYSLFSTDMPVLEKSAKAHHLLATESMIQALASPVPKPELVSQAHLHFMETVEIDPTFPLGWYDLARLRMMMDNQEGAMVAYQQSVQVDSFSAESFIDLGSLYEAQGQEGKALEMYVRALEIDRGNLELYASVSYLYVKKGDFDAAIATNEQAYGYFPNSFDVVANMGRSWLAKGDTAQAISWFEKAKALKPGVQGLEETLQGLYRSRTDSLSGDN